MASIPPVVNPAATFQHIQDTAAKRVSTLEYLGRAHEGRVFWCDALHFAPPDIARLPSFEPKRLARKAANLFLLGLSLPSALDINLHSPVDYLRALHALLLEFDAYQQVHPPDGSGASSLSRARIPHMFKRSNPAKARRTSAAADIGLPLPSGEAAGEAKALGGGGGAAGAAAGGAAANAASFAASEQELLPGEEYTHLLTPSLPFDPDFFEVFATLCDVLVDVYSRISVMVASPSDCVPGLAEVFAKADAKVRKLVISPVVSEFGDATRAGVKGEVAGVTKVILGGLM